MYPLSKYIQNINPMIKDSLDLHFYAEFILNESFKKSYFVIDEQYGSYIGQKELIMDIAKEIWPIIENNDPQNIFKYIEKDLGKYCNIFFNELQIILNTNRTSYASKLSKYDTNLKIFDKVIIYIDYRDLDCYNDLCSTIMHEMLHAHNEYMNYITKSKIKLKDLIGKCTPYSKTVLDDKSISVENICKRILHDIRKFEQNAYMSQLTIELENSNFDASRYHTTIEAYQAAKQIFINSEVWKQYTSLYRVLNKFKNSKDNVKKKFTNTYNDINNTDLSFDKIYKKLSIQFDKVLLRMENIIPKLFYNYYQNQISDSIKECGELHTSRKQLINFLNYMSLYEDQESIKPDNNDDWEVYVDGKIDSNFTKIAKNWKKFPKIGQGWYCSGTIFKIVDIKDNKVYTKTE